MTAGTAPHEIRRSPLGPYRVRGREATRLEAFSDAVFGFSATLLVVSLEVPSTFEELTADLMGFPAFGLSFLTLIFIWLAHRGFFRRYGLNDSWVTFLNMVLLFVVLFFVYPLKFLSVSFTEYALGISANRPSEAAIDPFTAASQVGALFVIYGLAFAAIFACIALLYRHAIACRKMLALDRLEVFDAWSIFGHYLIMASMPFVSIALVVIGVGGWAGGVGGWIYALLGPVMFTYWWLRGRRRDRLESQLAT